MQLLKRPSPASRPTDGLALRGPMVEDADDEEAPPSSPVHDNITVGERVGTIHRHGGERAGGRVSTGAADQRYTLRLLDKHRRA